MFDCNKYMHIHRPNLNPQYPSEFPTRTRHRVFIDNRDVANVTTSPFEFNVYIADPFRDTSIGNVPLKRVETVELKSLAFPKIANEDYVIVDIQQLSDDRMISTNDAANRSFAVMYFDSSDLLPGAIKPMRGLDHWQKDLLFNPVLPSVSTLSIAFRTRDGNVVTKAQTGNVTRCSMALEVITQDP